VLHERRYVDYDQAAEVVLDRHAIDYYKPKGPLQIKGAIYKLERLRQSSRRPRKRNAVTADEPRQLSTKSSASAR
jgi:hypothetical protein